MLSATGLGCGRILRSLYTSPLSHCVSRIIAKATPYDVPKSVLYYSVPVRSTIIYNVCNKFIAREHAILCRVHMAAIIDVSAKGNVDVLEVVIVSMQVSLRWLQGAFRCTESSPRDGDAVSASRAERMLPYTCSKAKFDVLNQTLRNRPPPTPPPRSSLASESTLPSRTRKLVP